jgi:5-methylcytosine-specific restriction endonuclease McrA
MRKCESCGVIDLPPKRRFCAVCNKQRQRTRSRICEANHREQLPNYRAAQAAYHRERRAADPVVAQLHRDKARSYAQANKQSALDRAAAWRRQNPERVRQLCRSWCDRHPEYLTYQSAKRRASVKSSGSPGVKPEQWREICETFGNVCAYCLRARRLTRDHVIPIARGGRDEPANVVPACQPCNSSKGRKLLALWYFRRVAA